MQFLQGRKSLESGESKKRRLKAYLVYGHVDFQKLALSGYIRDLLLNPPPYDIASKIQATCKRMSNVTCTIPEFTCVSSAKLVKLLEQREANHIEFCRIKNLLDDILHMYKNSELNEILKLLMDPSWAATGLKIDFETLVTDVNGLQVELVK
nr:dna mismatch repair protein msh1, mitochondrial [Quercus suber]